MKYLFSNAGIKTLEGFYFAEPLIAFDYDGTLSKIVRDPSDAEIKPQIIKMLQIVKRELPLAVISGRSLINLKQIFPIKDVHLIGNHGLEIDGRSNRQQQAALRATRRWKNFLQNQIPLGLGIYLEDKKYSLSLHYRKALHKKAAKSEILMLLPQLDPAPRIVKGKAVFNLISEAAPHKGMAIVELMKKLKRNSAIYIGDDDTDEDVFDMNHEHILTIRVGFKKNSQARFFIKNQSEIGRFIKTLLQLQEHMHRHG